MRPKRRENKIFKSRERYYIVYIYKYYWLILFLILIEKFDQKSYFHSRLAWTSPYKSQIGEKQGENEVFKSRE